MVTTPSGDVREVLETVQPTWICDPTPESLAEGWKRSSQPGYPRLEPFVQLRPVVVDYLRSNPGKPWLGA